MMVRPGVNKFNDRSHWGIPYLVVFVRNTSKTLSFLFRSLDQFRKTTLICCVHVRDFKSSLLMSPAINLVFGEVSRMLSQKSTKNSIKAVSQ